MKTMAMTEKCFPDERLEDKREYVKASMLRGERFSFQLGLQYAEACPAKTVAHLYVESSISDDISLQRIDYVPVRLPVNFGVDDGNYLRTAPGLYPDLLRPMTEKTRIPVTEQLTSIWVDINAPADAAAGAHGIRFILRD